MRPVVRLDAMLVPAATLEDTERKITADQMVAEAASVLTRAYPKSVSAMLGRWCRLTMAVRALPC